LLKEKHTGIAEQMFLLAVTANRRRMGSGAIVRGSTFAAPASGALGIWTYFYNSYLCDHSKNNYNI